MSSAIIRRNLPSQPGKCPSPNRKVKLISRAAGRHYNKIKLTLMAEIDATPVRPKRSVPIAFDYDCEIFFEREEQIYKVGNFLLFRIGAMLLPLDCATSSSGTKATVSDSTCWPIKSARLENFSAMDVFSSARYYYYVALLKTMEWC